MEQSATCAGGQGKFLEVDNQNAQMLGIHPRIEWSYGVKP